MVDWVGLALNAGSLATAISLNLPAIHSISDEWISKFGVFLGTFMFYPAPSNIELDIHHKLIKVPIPGMNGNKLQYFGSREPIIYLKGRWIYDEEAKIGQPEVFYNLMRQNIKLWNGIPMPFVSMVLPQYRMVTIEYENYRNVPGRPSDIEYEFVLVQNGRYGAP